MGKSHVACLLIMFFDGRLAMPHIRHENVRHATLLFCAEGVNVRTTGAGERRKEMMHELKMNVKSSDVTRTGVSFTLHNEDGKSGTLEVRVGSLTWYSGRRTKNNKCAVSWEDFDQYMKQHKK